MDSDPQGSKVYDIQEKFREKHCFDTLLFTHWWLTSLSINLLSDPVLFSSDYMIPRVQKRVQRQINENGITKSTRKAGEREKEMVDKRRIVLAPRGAIPSAISSPRVRYLEPGSRARESRERREAGASCLSATCAKPPVLCPSLAPLLSGNHLSVAEFDLSRLAARRHV